MRNNHSFLRDVLSTVGNAILVAGAVHRGARPADKNLTALGIDPVKYKQIKHYY